MNKIFQIPTKKIDWKDYDPSKTKVLVGIDRDNTINLDDDTYFGTKDNWQDELEFCPNAISGLQILSKLDYVALVVVSSQVGVAKGVMTTERVDEINSVMDEILIENNVKINSWQYCPFVDQSGANRWVRNGIETVNYNFVCEDGDERLEYLKPKDGLLKKAAKELGIDYDRVDKYFLGDRMSDVECGINADGIGILVDNPAIKRGSSVYDNTTRIQIMAQNHRDMVYKVDNLVQAASLIKKQTEAKYN